MKNHLIKTWLPLAIVGTIVMFSLYAAIQQDIRIGANDPQIQMAVDGAVALARGSSPYALVGQNRVDIGKSLAPFMIIYDESGKVVAYSGELNGQVPVLPAGVFDYASNNPDDRITWQPASTTRIAAVVRHFTADDQNATMKSGYIVAGRNMREIEHRIKQIGLMVGTGWIALIILSLVASAYAWVLEKKADTI